MTAGIFARVPAIAALVAIALLATATLTLAATSTSPAPAATAAPGAAAAPATLVVPDVRRQVYVFAKGTLEQSGFAWKVAGPVQGYAANVVVSQSPAPGTRVVADGMPIIRLTLSRNASYKQDGLPESASPYRGRPVRLPGLKPKTGREGTRRREEGREAGEARREAEGRLRRPSRRGNPPSPFPARHSSRSTRSR